MGERRGRALYRDGVASRGAVLFSGCAVAALDYAGNVGTNGSVAIGNGLYLIAKYDNIVGNLYGAVTLIVTSAPELPPSITIPSHIALTENTAGAINGLSIAAPSGESLTAISLGLFFFTMVLSWRLTNAVLDKGPAFATGIFSAMFMASLLVLFTLQGVFGLVQV